MFVAFDRAPSPEASLARSRSAVALMRASVLATVFSVASDAVGPKDAKPIGNWPRALQNGLVSLSAEAGLTAVAPVRDRVVPTSMSAANVRRVFMAPPYWLLCFVWFLLGLPCRQDCTGHTSVRSWKEVRPQSRRRVVQVKIRPSRSQLHAKGTGRSVGADGYEIETSISAKCVPRTCFGGRSQINVGRP